MPRPAVLNFTVGRRTFRFHRDTLGYNARVDARRITLRPGKREPWLFKEEGELVAWGRTMEAAVTTGIEELARRKEAAARLKRRGWEAPWHR